mgnify:CR=1 FL=1
MESFPSFDWDEIVPKETKVFWRHRWNEYRDRYGFPYSRGYMQNLDSLGAGPEDAFVLGGKIGYRRTPLVRFFNSLPFSRLSKGKVGGAA